MVFLCLGGSLGSGTGLGGVFGGGGEGSCGVVCYYCCCGVFYGGGLTFIILIIIYIVFMYRGASCTILYTFFIQYRQQYG